MSEDRMSAKTVSAKTVDAAKQSPQPVSDKPGERTPPPDMVAAHVKAQPERKKPAGLAGVPSPVGENDLA